MTPPDAPEAGRALAIDLFCGLGGWTKGLQAEGWDVVGFDIERHVYGEHRYPAQLVLQDVRTIHGSQFRNVDLIVASSPCQEFSYRAMPWKRAKALPPPYLGMELFAQAKRIQREASEAAGRYIPMVQENVRGAQKWVGKADWHYGSYYLWGDVPALMVPVTKAYKSTDLAQMRNGASRTRHLTNQAEHDAVKGAASWFGVSPAGVAQFPRNPARGAGTDGMGVVGARKAASARIAMIPLPLARHIARVYYPLPGGRDG